MRDGSESRIHRYRIPIAITLLALVGLFIGLVMHYFYPTRGSEAVVVTIREGENTAQIGAELHARGVVTSATLFRFLAWLEGKQGRFKAGRYVFNTGMHYGEVFAMLEDGPDFEARLIIPEGLTVRQTAERVSAVTEVSVEEFEAAAASGDHAVAFIPPDRQSDLEGFLFPKTYDIARGTPARAIVDMLLRQFAAEVGGLDWSRAETLGVTPYGVMIVASLIEREAVLEEERPLVAAVIYNRLDRGMLLQIDASVQYALPEWKEVLTYADLKTPSPYNTYLHAGLPPGPICSPGLASIKAALDPAPTDHLYYVATGNGGHFFTSDYDEFLRAKEEAQR